MDVNPVAPKKRKYLWAMSNIVKPGKVERITTFATFTEAMDALALRSGDWWANWSCEEVGKGTHYIIPVCEE